MIPSEVVSAHDERSLVPTKYTSSKTLAGSVYQRARSGGGGPGGTSRGGAVRGFMQSAARTPGKSKPAAALAARRRASISFPTGCAAAGPPPMTADKAASTKANPDKRVF